MTRVETNLILDPISPTFCKESVARITHYYNAFSAQQTIRRSSKAATQGDHRVAASPEKGGQRQGPTR
jgi:hypothetical protein